MTRVRLSNRPLLDTRTDAALFVARDRELARLRRSLELGVNVLLRAAPGLGKTSLLRHLAWREREAGRRSPHYLSGTPAGSVAELITLVAGVLGVELSPDNDPLDLLDRLTAELKEFEQAPVILLDEPDPELAYTLFGRLRDEVWELPLVWVVAMDTADAVRLLRPPADAFFEVRLELPRLTAPELGELLRRRLPADADGAVSPDVVAELAASGDPRRALDDARQLLTGGLSWADLKRERSHRDHVVGELGRPARMVVDALTRLGGSASASDAELLDQLGWTRPRAVQVLSELEEAGVLVSATVRPTGVGRPRKVYRLNEAGEA